jgi:oligoribonuclease (3'-5' exoribonuclease)
MPRFLLRQMPEVMKHLSYRIVGESKGGEVRASDPPADTHRCQLGQSTCEMPFKGAEDGHFPLTPQELCRRWYPTVRAREQSARTGEATHR